MPRTKRTPSFWRTFTRHVRPVTVIRPDGTREVEHQTFEQVDRLVREAEDGRICQRCELPAPPSRFRNRAGRLLPWCRACRMERAAGNTSD